MRLRRFLAMSTALLLVVIATVVVYNQLDVASDGGDQVVSGPDATATTVPAVEVQVHGTVTVVLIADAVLQPREVPTPLTISSERGFGNGGELTSVQVDGKSSTIEWDGGRPLTLSSGGALRLDPVGLTLVPEGLKAVLGQANHALVPGTYQLDTPVAVGQEGIATPRDSVTFDAVEGSLLEARGDASLIFGPDAPRRFVGPGKVLITGTFEITDSNGTRSASSLGTEVVPFDLTFTPDGAGGWTVDGVVDGAVTAP